MNLIKKAGRYNTEPEAMGLEFGREEEESGSASEEEQSGIEEK